jgi:regulator of replication initiation timing
MKALVGSWENRPYRLLAELTALRTRVGELQEELALAREENAMLREALRDDDIEVVFSTVSTA